jgi:hypothetical protein
MIKPLIDRFDLVFVFKDTRDESYLTEYADKKSEMEDNPTADNIEYLMKYIMYAKQQHKPTFSDEAKSMLNQYYVKVRSQNFGSNRVRETVYSIAQNIARLKLKTQVDAADASETMKFYNVILQQLGKIVSLPSSPKDIAYNECLHILEDSAFPIAYEEVIKTACEKNTQVNKYIGNSLKLRDNVTLRYILDMLTNHSHVKVIQMKPTVLQWVNGNVSAKGNDSETIVKALSQACDPCDICDPQTDTPTEKIEDSNGKNIAEVSDLGSHGSHRSHTNDNNGNSSLLKCYWCEKVGNSFQTNDEMEYLKHGTLKHLNRPMYPNIATIKENSLKPQGRKWEV